MIYYKDSAKFACPRCGLGFPFFHSIGWTQVVCDLCYRIFTPRGTIENQPGQQRIVWQDEPISTDLRVPR